MSDEYVTVQNHADVYMMTASGDCKRVSPCTLTDDDINDDGTINYPPSGECDCEILRPGVAADRSPTDSEVYGRLKLDEVLSRLEELQNTLEDAGLGR